jgi:hypothetical protein
VLFDPIGSKKQGHNTFWKGMVLQTFQDKVQIFLEVVEQALVQIENREERLDKILEVVVALQILVVVVLRILVVVE